MLKQPDRARKLAPKFSGPYTVNRVRENKFTIRDNTEGNKQAVHVDRLKRVTRGVTRTHGESEIDSVIQIRD